MKITPDLLLRAYAIGVFPMAESRDAPIFWVDPIARGVIPLDNFHVSHSLRKRIRRRDYAVTVDREFDAVLDACATPTPARPDTWISADIARLYKALHRIGCAHSVETLRDGRLVGGLYGVRIGAAFFGESMFSRADDASKVALTYLVARLNAGGFRLLDAQFLTDHLAQFGAIEITRNAYRSRLNDAIDREADFTALPEDPDPAYVLQLCSQTS